MTMLLRRVLPQPIYAGGHVHLVPDHIVSPSLRRRLLEEVGPDWFACVFLANGHGVLMPSGPYLPFEPPEERADHIRRLAIYANRGAGHGGYWVTALDPDLAWFALWFDQDGDHQFTVQSNEPWERERHESLTEHVQLLESAWLTWDARMQDLDLRPGETFRRAQGERAPSGRPDAAA